MPLLAPDFRFEPGLLDYVAATTAMQTRAAAIRAEGARELVWLVEHPPLFTAGTSADPADLSNPLHLPTYDAGRGGQWTYHGPGQRTAYVMLDLSQAHGRIPPRDIKKFVWGLEEWLISALDRFNVRGERREGRVGIWVVDGGADKKIGAIGVRVTRWVSWHGVALNVAPNLDHFAGIVPCGIREHGVTSLEALGITATIEEVDAALVAAWPGIFGAATIVTG
jgi:lipoyl(octanoyl) transferase